MRTQIIVAAVAVLLAVCVGFLVQSATHAESPVAGKYQLVVDGGHMYLCDTTSGAVWLRYIQQVGPEGKVLDEWRLERTTFHQLNGQTDVDKARRSVVPK